MKYKNIKYLLILLAIIQNSCELKNDTTTTSNNDSSKTKSVTLTDTSKTSTNYHFTVSTKNLRTDTNTLVPNVDIYISSKAFKNPVFLVTDYNLLPIETKERQLSFGIPDKFEFAFWSWYAGGGACYYGIVENKKLKVYRKYLEESETEIELQFELFKSFSLE